MIVGSRRIGACPLFGNVLVYRKTALRPISRPLLNQLMNARFVDLAACEECASPCGQLKPEQKCFWLTFRLADLLRLPTSYKPVYGHTEQVHKCARSTSNTPRFRFRPSVIRI